MAQNHAKGLYESIRPTHFPDLGPFNKYYWRKVWYNMGLIPCHFLLAQKCSTAMCLYNITGQIVCLTG